MSDMTKADLRDKLGNIDQIRDILFGPQLREYGTRMEQLERSLSGLQQDIRNRTDEVKQVLSTEIQALTESFDKKLKALALKDDEEKFDLRQQIDLLGKRLASTTDEVKQSLAAEIREASDSLEQKIKSWDSKDSEEKSEIRQQLDVLSKRITDNVGALNETIDTQTTSLRDDLLSSREKLQEDILGLRNQLFEELERRISMLLQTKVSRDDMAELLFELGLRLKGTEFVPELRDVASGTGLETLLTDSGNDEG